VKLALGRGEKNVLALVSGRMIVVAKNQQLAASASRRSFFA